MDDGMHRNRGCGAPCVIRLPLLFAVLAMGLTACGGGGTSSDELAPTPQALFVIRTESLPTGHVNEVYPDTTLVLEAPNPSAAWWSLYSGALPPGLILGPDGVIGGTPTLAGMWVFTVRAQDGPFVALMRLAIAIDTFGAFVQEGLTAGAAWTERSVRIRVAGGTGPFSFSAQSQSGGSLVGFDALGGTATYAPGTGVAIDRITALDDAENAATIDLDVRRNPLTHRFGRFGTTDVWFVDFHVKTGVHPFASDWHASLSSVSLRDPASHAAVGAEADDLCDLWMRLEFHRALNQHYLREASGAQGPNGLPIGFVWDRPAAPHTTPVPGGRTAGGVHRYSTVGVAWIGGSATAGRALVDDPDNGTHEHNAPAPDEPLGVFVDTVANAMRHLTPYSVLQHAALTGSDVPTLEALINGHALPDTERARAIRDVGQGLARSLAKVTAHETAHSLGLGHTEPPQPGSLMNPTIDIHPGATAFFTHADIAALRFALPGPGRLGPASLLQSVHRGTVCTCDLAAP